MIYRPTGNFFRDSWKNYATATKLDQKDKKIVTATLLSVMGKECLHVCRNLPLTEDERQDADVILMKLGEYFEPKRNTIYERYVFNSHSQKPGESFDQFLAELHKLAATCQFRTFEDEMLYDHIVTGLQDYGHREQLTLQKAVDICHTNEMAANQRHKMEQLDNVHYTHEQKKHDAHEDSRKTSNSAKKCNYCGDTHRAGNCPAYGQTCTKCKKKNHLAKACQSSLKQMEGKSKLGARKAKPMRDTQHHVHHVQEDDVTDELSSNESIYTVRATKDTNNYAVEIYVSARKLEVAILLKFQIDTRGSCSTITLQDFKKVTDKKPQPTNTKLKLYDHSVIHPIGSTTVYCTAHGV